MNYEYYMLKAYELALAALAADETPVGAVITLGEKIIGRGCNQRVTKKNPLYHAEISAINEAAAFMGDWRLEGCTIFVTVEPCPMCAGAIVQARIKELVFGAPNPKAGCAGSVMNILDHPGFNHRVDIVSGIMAEPCGRLMSEFFKKFRGAE
ncbi:MAG: tRNA adenosine(34) deaminase TadA [Clostridiales bacterium]|nr:tRNA adenosine(34) deaminase TadA [Clostridiales bacterium]